MLNGERWTEVETDKFYRAVLKDAGEIANRSVGKGYEESRRKTWAEFESFIQKVGNGVIVESARGIDIVAFVHGEWINNHTKTAGPLLGQPSRKFRQLRLLRG